MDKATLQQEIVKLDQQIHHLSGSIRLASTGGRDKFPIAPWLAAAVVGAYGAMGGTIGPLADIYSNYGGPYFLYAGGVLALYAAYRTFVWISRGRPTGNAEYNQVSTKIQELKRQRETLRQQMTSAE